MLTLVLCFLTITAQASCSPASVFFRNYGQVLYEQLAEQQGPSRAVTVAEIAALCLPSRSRTLQTALRIATTNDDSQSKVRIAYMIGIAKDPELRDSLALCGIADDPLVAILFLQGWLANYAYFVQNPQVAERVSESWKSVFVNIRPHIRSLEGVVLWNRAFGAWWGEDDSADIRSITIGNTPSLAAADRVCELYYSRYRGESVETAAVIRALDAIEFDRADQAAYMARYFPLPEFLLVLCRLRATSDSQSASMLEAAIDAISISNVKCIDVQQNATLFPARAEWIKAASRSEGTNDALDRTSGNARLHDAIAGMLPGDPAILELAVTLDAPDVRARHLLARRLTGSIQVVRQKVALSAMNKLVDGDASLFGAIDKASGLVPISWSASVLACYSGIRYSTP